MKIGIPTETKTDEYRVGMTPGGVREVSAHGHAVVVQQGAGAGVGMGDGEYREAGASIAESAADVFASTDMIVKVKEPQPEECRMLREQQVLFTYLHLAPDPNQAGLLRESGVVAIAYETVTGTNNSLPLLAPMSEVAGRMSVQAAAHSLEKAHSGSGVLLGGVPGVAAAEILVIGGGVVGTNALRMALGLGARVTVVDKSIERLKELDVQIGSQLNTIYSTTDALEHYAAQADAVIGAVLIPGASAPKLVTRNILKSMRPGSVFVDVAIDQGGCAETSRPTTHSEPTYVEEGVVHYCVANMPGAVPRTSTLALNNATLPFILALADKGYRRALLEDRNLMAGLNVYRGRITHSAVAEALGRDYVPVHKALGSSLSVVG